MDGYYFLIHVHVPWRIITRSNGGPGSFECYFNGGKILCVYMYIGDYFYRWLFQGVWTLFDYIEYTHLEYFSGVLFLSFFLYILPDPLASITNDTRESVFGVMEDWLIEDYFNGGRIMCEYIEYFNGVLI